MLLMLRLLVITLLLLSSFVDASPMEKKVEEFLTEQFSENQNIENVKVKVDTTKPLKELTGWKAYIVDIEAKLKRDPKSLIKQKMIWFSNGKMITKELTDLVSGDNLSEVVKPNFKASYYKDENRIYGDKNAAHKVAIFSDPLCPFCRGFVPGAIADMKKEPKKFAIYYYHFPLPRIHPASVELVKAAAAAEQQGYKDVVAKLYNVKINPAEKDVEKILAAFNKAEGTHITAADLNKPSVLAAIKFDFDVANNVMVGGTPTVYIDGKIDTTKKKYLKIK